MSSLDTAEDEWNVERLSVGKGLLNARVNRVVIVLYLNYRDWDVWLEIKDVVGSLLCPTRVKFSSDINPSVGKPDLFPKLCM